MRLEFTFKEVCEFIKEDDPKLIDAVDKLLGMAILFSPIVSGPAGAVLLPLLGVKNELIKLGKTVFEAFATKKDEDYLSRQTRMEMAYGLISYTAFFEALDRQLPKDLRKKIGSIRDENLQFALKAHEKVCADVKTIEQGVEVPGADRFLAVRIAFPHPTESLEQLENRHAELYQKMAEGFGDFVQKLKVWDETTDNERKKLTEALQALPRAAKQHFEAQYVALCSKFDDSLYGQICSNIKLLGRSCAQYRNTSTAMQL